MLFCCREPHSVVGGIAVGLFAQDQNDLFFDVNCGAAKHPTRDGREFGEGIEHDVWGIGFRRFKAKGSSGGN